eukprot:CCRYP_018931-RE/>CCRYP_018931-RE protein AED:0.42 eAED:0.42 QI:0/-1/0/1/-1/0/1/0/28
MDMRFHWLCLSYQPETFPAILAPQGPPT